MESRPRYRRKNWYHVETSTSNTQLLSPRLSNFGYKNLVPPIVYSKLVDRGCKENILSLFTDKQMLVTSVTHETRKYNIFLVWINTDGDHHIVTGYVCSRDDSPL